MHASESYDRLYQLAVSIRATEMAVFSVSRESTGYEMTALGHVRPDKSTNDQRAAALVAFQDVIRPCLMAGANGAIEVGDPASNGRPMYCLVILARHDQEIIGAAAYIVRCKDQRGAQAALSLLEAGGDTDWHPLFRPSK